LTVPIQAALQNTHTTLHHSQHGCLVGFLYAKTHLESRLLWEVTG